MKKLLNTLIIILSLILLIPFSNTLNASDFNLENDVTIQQESEGFFMGLDEDGNIVNMYNEEDNKPKFKMRLFNMDPTYKVIDNQTQEVVQTYLTLNNATDYFNESDDDLQIQQYGETVNVKYGILKFLNTNNNINTYVIDENTGLEILIHANYGRDAAFLGYDDSGRIRFKIAGMTGIIPDSEKNNVAIYNFSDITGNISAYYTKNNILYHGITTKYDLDSTTYASSQNMGAKPSYLENDKTYYSYDGHYFYNDFNKMIDDYKADHYNNSINKNEPFYNYFQFLSHRSISNATAKNIDDFIAANTNSSSKLIGTGEYFKQYEAEYGVNALLMLGVAINESGWGTSYIATTKNNLFGHSAYDSDPSGSADAYSSPAFSIKYHASVWVSNGYANSKDWRYNGAHLGNKASGMNVRYASDPYWAEKAASQAHRIEQAGYTNESKKETIAIKQSNIVLNVRKEPFSSSTLLYQTKKIFDYPFKIIGEAKGDVFNNSDVWYKIQSDPVLDSNRENAIKYVDGFDSKYNMSNMYGYVHSSYVDVVHQADDSNTNINPSYESNKIISGLNMKVLNNILTDISINTSVKNFKTNISKINSSALVYVYNNSDIRTNDEDTIKTSYRVKIFIDEIEIMNYKIAIKGDINGDGKISSSDYILAANHLLKKNLLTNELLIALDVNGDNKFNSADYIALANHILGKSSIY